MASIGGITLEAQMAYADLSDEDKLEQAIRFVAVGQPLPAVLEQFLRENNLYELIVNRRLEVELTRN